jgi:hypothetical protein
LKSFLAQGRRTLLVVVFLLLALAGAGVAAVTSDTQTFTYTVPGTTVAIPAQTYTQTVQIPTVTETVTQTVTAPTEPAPIWNGDLEPGDFSQYAGGTQAFTADRTTVVTSASALGGPVSARQGTKFFQSLVKSGDNVVGGERAEILQGSLGMTNGADQWYQWSLALPANYPAGGSLPGSLLGQWHSDSNATYQGQSDIQYFEAPNMAGANFTYTASSPGFLLGINGGDPNQNGQYYSTNCATCGLPPRSRRRHLELPLAHRGRLLAGTRLTTATDRRVAPSPCRAPPGQVPLVPPARLPAAHLAVAVPLGRDRWTADALPPPCGGAAWRQDALGCVGGPVLRAAPGGVLPRRARHESQRPLWVWVLAKDYKIGRPSLMTFIEVIRQVGLIRDKDYRYNKTEKVFEFYRGEELLSTVEFKSADDPQNLRGAGLDILWIDESAFITSRDAWDVVFPALADREGRVITTTTPNGKNWFWQTFWSDESLEDDDAVPRRVHEHRQPVLPALAVGVRAQALPPDHVPPGVHGGLRRDGRRGASGRLAPLLRPRQPGRADRRHRPAAGEGRGRSAPLRAEDVHRRRPGDLAGGRRRPLRDGRHRARQEQPGYLLDYFYDRIAFPDQLDKIREWFLKWRPEGIGIESNAYQRALVQMTARMDGLPPIAPSSPSRRRRSGSSGSARCSRPAACGSSAGTRQFIDQWVSYDPAKKNGDDDLLDAVEIALGVAGVLLPQAPLESLFGEERGTQTLEEIAWAAGAVREEP